MLPPSYIPRRNPPPTTLDLPIAQHRLPANDIERVEYFIRDVYGIRTAPYITIITAPSEVTPQDQERGTLAVLAARVSERTEDLKRTYNADNRRHLSDLDEFFHDSMLYIMEDVVDWGLTNGKLDPDVVKSRTIDPDLVWRAQHVFCEDWFKRFRATARRVNATREQTSDAFSSGFQQIQTQGSMWRHPRTTDEDVRKILELHAAASLR